VAVTAGAISALRVFQHGNTLFLILGLAFLVCGIGLWFNQQWARWATVLLMVLLSAECAVLMLTKKINLLRGVYLPLSLYGSWLVWKEFSPTKITEAARKKRPLISLVLLLRKHRYLEAKILAQIVSSAWGEDYSSGDDAEEKSGRFVVGESPLFIINSPQALFMLNNLDRPYFDDLQAVLHDLKELRLRKALEDHKAWMSVDLISVFDTKASPESVYPRIAKLIAELAGSDSTAIYQPQTNNINVWDASLEEKLRGPNALEEFARPAYVPVINVEDDDPRMKAAVAEARSRWPEFVQAFNQRDGELFSVKAPITIEDRTEFIWIKVDGLEPEFIHGTLGNDPVDLPGLKLGDRFEIPLTDLNDWAFVRNGQPFGLFTTKAIAQIQKERQTKSR
jgi:uncharacterized protein YegJ (DUF2314 family)